MTGAVKEPDAGAAVDVVHDGPLSRITFNRPDKLNAVDAQLIEEALDGLRAAVRREARLVVFAGAGQAFSAGFDLSNLDAQSDGDLVLRFIRIETLLQEIYTAPVTTLALAHGRCFGAAADIFCACSQRIASPDATFRMPGLRFGIVLGTRRFARLVGTDRVRDILATSRVFDVHEGVAMGFVQKVVETEQWADVVAAATSVTQTLTPEAQRRMMRNSREESSDVEMAELVRSAAEPGLAERIRAFAEAARRKNS